MDIDGFKLRCSTSIVDCSLLTLEFGNIHLVVDMATFLKDFMWGNGCCMGEEQ